MAEIRFGQNFRHRSDAVILRTLRTIQHPEGLNITTVKVDNAYKGKPESIHYDEDTGSLSVFISASNPAKAQKQLDSLLLSQGITMNGGPYVDMSQPVDRLIRDLSNRYLLCPNALERLYQECVWKSLSRMPEQTKVLEIGAGEGGPLKFYTPQQRSVLTALDIDFGALTRLRGAYPEVRTLGCDIRCIDMPDGSFDACIGTNSLYLATSPEQLCDGFTEIDRVLRGNKHIIHVMSGSPVGLTENWGTDGSADPEDPEEWIAAYENMNRTMVRELRSMGYKAKLQFLRVWAVKPIDEMNEIQRKLVSKYEELPVESGIAFELRLGHGEIIKPNMPIPEGHFGEIVFAYFLSAQIKQPGIFSRAFARLFKGG